MPKGPKGEKRPADVISNAVKIAQIATGEIEDDMTDDGKDVGVVNLLGTKSKLLGIKEFKFFASIKTGNSVPLYFLPRHIHMLSLYFVHYNFCRIHKTLKVTPAMEAGLSKTVHDMEWIVGLIDAMAAEPKRRGPYKKRISN